MLSIAALLMYCYTPIASKINLEALTKTYHRCLFSATKAMLLRDTIFAMVIDLRVSLLTFLTLSKMKKARSKKNWRPQQKTFWLRMENFKPLPYMSRCIEWNFSLSTVFSKQVWQREVPSIKFWWHSNYCGNIL